MTSLLRISIDLVREYFQVLMLLLYQAIYIEWCRLKVSQAVARLILHFRVIGLVRQPSIVKQLLTSVELGLSHTVPR